MSEDSAADAVVRLIGQITRFMKAVSARPEPENDDLPEPPFTLDEEAAHIAPVASQLGSSD
jgi:hypothetical protein